MFEFYSWSSNARLWITFFFAFCVLFQAISAVLSRYRYPKLRLYRYETILEAALLLQILCLSLMHGHVIMNFSEGSIAPSGYAALRMLSFLCVMILAVWVSYQGRTPWPLLTILSALVLLPPVETATGKAYPYLFLLSLCFLLIRSIHLCLLRYREIKSGFSALSVKEAIDNLETGILFCRADGSILLQSHRMQQLMLQITGEVYRDGRLFYERLCSGAYDERCESAELDEKTVCLLPDGTAWMFTGATLCIKNKSYLQLTASDVTERFCLTTELKAQDEALKARSEELRETIANLQALSRDREAQKAKMRAHDVLGQRLTLLLRMLHGDQTLDVPLLKSLSEGMLHELSLGTEAPSPQEELIQLRQVFGAIGVSLRFDGSLPGRADEARLFVDIIREGVVNAVRHGFATEIAIRCAKEAGLWRLHIENNGHPPTLPIVEGGGLSAMREKLLPNGGSLQLMPTPQFALSVTLPGGAE